MQKHEVKYYYSIMKHTRGTGYDHDCLMLDEDFQPLRYIYEASAMYKKSLLENEYGSGYKFYIVRLYNEYY